MAKQYFKPGNMLYPLPAVMVSCQYPAGKEDALCTNPALAGKPNIITVAWAGTVCTNPPMLSISVRPERYSYHMIEESGEFVVNLTTEQLVLGKNLPPVITKSKIVPADKDWEFIVKMTLIIRDILYGNPRLDEMGWHEEALGRNAVVGGFQGQRQWTDWLPNADFTEAIMASTFDWNGPKAPTPFATENDTCNGIAMMLGSLVSGSAPCFHDVRTYWSPEACERVTGQKPDGVAANGFIHLINSGATALDGSGACVDAKGNHVMKPFWEMTDTDIKACLNATDWCRADYEYFRGGGYSSHFRCKAEMPVTMLRFNIVEGIGPVLQIAEGWTADLPDEIHNTIDKRTDPTWPTTWFCPRLTGQGAFTDVYSVMANWGANHGVTVYGHVGADLITLASMLRIPVTMHNVPAEKVYRPHAWASFGTQDQQAADYAACKQYGPLYR